MLTKKQIILLFFVCLCVVSSFHDARADRLVDVMNNIIEEHGKIKIGIIGVGYKAGDSSPQSIDEFMDVFVIRSFLNMLKKNQLEDKVILVDRRELNRIMEEQKLIASGLTDAKAVKIGRIAALDVILFVTIYVGDENGNLTSKFLSVETGEILAIESEPIPVIKEPEPIVLANESFSVQPSTYKPFIWDLKKGTVLKIAVRSNSDVDVWFMDYPNFKKFRNDQGFLYYPKASGERIYNADYEIEIPADGTYYFVVSNEFSMLTSKGVTVYATAIKPN